MVVEYIPDKNQVACAKFMLKNPASGAFLDMGEGKTSISCMVYGVLKKKKLTKGMIVITTMQIVNLDVWPEEIKKFGFDITHTVLHGKDKNKNIKKDVDLYMINFEGLPWLLENIKHLNADILILDESDQAKGYRTTRFKIFKILRTYFKRRYLLTGTPSTNSYMDLFSQIYILDGGDRLGQFITHFRNKFFTPTGFGGFDYKLQHDGAKRIQDAIKDIIFRPHTSAVKLKKLKYNDVVLKLPKKLREDYNELEEEFILEMDEGIITAVNSAAKHSKLKQFCNGSIYDEDKNIINIHNLKINALKKIVKELDGEPLLVGYEFRHDLKALLKAFPRTPYFGTTVEGKKPTKTDALKIQNDWNSGKLVLLFGQTSAIARGLNLQKRGYNIMSFSHLSKLSDVLQFIARLRRRGQKKSVVWHRLIVEDSVDGDVIASNEVKTLTQKDLLKAMRKRVKARNPKKKVSKKKVKKKTKK